VSVVFVSHKLKEVLEVSDSVTVLRNGRTVASGEVGAFSWERIALEMTGRELGAETNSLSPPQKKVILAVRDLGLKNYFSDVSFSLRAGEVLGIAGLLGSGRTALATTLFGLTPADEGTVEVEGREVALRSPADAVAAGLGYVPEDRLTEGLFLTQSVGRNIVSSKLNELSRGGFKDKRLIRAEQDRWIEHLNIATPSAELPVQNLSGGNQQRVVLARWLATRPKVLMLVGPTVGVDVGSKTDIHRIIAQLAAEGMGVIIVSDDILELLNNTHRILVMRAGRVTEMLAPAGLSEDALATKLTREASA
jgi:simple sugar transport system ATP-binding protein